ncbi:MAG TPA: glycogen synthase GlgA [Candidatus Saccharimonadales bacterium]|nr:glycogen synthase GlgA [Candidatus Saccharimonadales bacterium]
MHVLFAASECVPFSKTGGLADVAGALPRAVAELGHQVTVYLPLYRQTRLKNPKTVIASITVPFDDRYRFCSVLDGGQQHGVQFYFIDYPPFYDRDALYGTPLGDYHDNPERFALYCRAVLEAAKILGVPDVFHCHDWQTALIPVLLRTLYDEDPSFSNIPTVFTIHNMGYQGIFSPDTLPLLMLPWDLFTITKLEFFGKINFLKGALTYSDFITTVSRKYAQEIQTVEYGFGLEGVLRSRNPNVAGILNGVDYNEWNPETDCHIASHFSPDSLDGKKECRRDLLSNFSLDPESTTPVIGIVSRFAAQKGFDLISLAADRLARENVTVVTLGAGDKDYEDLFRRLVRQYPGRFAVKVGYDNELAHKIEAGSDMFLMPSRYEPCGLNQIYSLKYGTVPIVRATGGLDDTIDPFDTRTGKGTGFKFHEYTPEALLTTVRAALACFSKPAEWRKLMLNGMSKDFSWTVAAREYIRIYEKLRANRHALP